MMKISLGKLPLQNYKWTVPQSKLPNIYTFRVTKLCKETSTFQNIAQLTSPPPDTTWWTFPGILPTEFITLDATAKVCSSDETRNKDKGLNITWMTRKKSGKLRATPSQESGRGSLHINHMIHGEKNRALKHSPWGKGSTSQKTLSYYPKD